MENYIQILAEKENFNGMIMVRIHTNNLYCFNYIFIFGVDQNDTEFKKPLFSDNEDENDEVLSDDDQAEQWRKERYKRESFLSKVLIYHIIF